MVAMIKFYVMSILPQLSKKNVYMPLIPINNNQKKDCDTPTPAILALCLFRDGCSPKCVVKTSET